MFATWEIAPQLPELVEDVLDACNVITGIGDTHGSRHARKGTQRSAIKEEFFDGDGAPLVGPVWDRVSKLRGTRIQETQCISQVRRQGQLALVVFRPRMRRVVAGLGDRPALSTLVIVGAHIAVKTRAFNGGHVARVAIVVGLHDNVRLSEEENDMI
jgi:hypothetical protein